MRSGEDLSQARPCTACRGASFRHVAESVGKKTYWGVQGLAVEDPKTNQGQIVNGFLVMAAYVCATCGHVDFYSTRVRK